MLRTSKEDITLALDSALPVNSIEENIYKDSKTEGKINILETLSTGKDEADIITNKVALNKVLNSLEVKDKKIIMLRYFKNLTQSDVAKIMGISQVQVSRLEKKILNKMKIKLA